MSENFCGSRASVRNGSGQDATDRLRATQNAAAPAVSYNAREPADFGRYFVFALAIAYVPMNTKAMSAFGSPAPKFELYLAAVDKQTGRIASVGMSAPGVLADASEKTGLPKDCFELRQISREEYERVTG